MKTYSKAPDAVVERAAHLIAIFHPQLKEIGVKIDFLAIANDDETKPGLTHQGYPAAAVVRLLGIKERTMGRGDAEIVIDEHYWMGLDEAEKDALLDHELYHLVVPKRLVYDERGRPKLKIRKHDRQMGWFDEIAKRHGHASGEVKQAMNLVASAKQIYFDFANIQAMPALMARVDAAIAAGKDQT